MIGAVAARTLSPFAGSAYAVSIAGRGRLGRSLATSAKLPAGRIEEPKDTAGQPSSLANRRAFSPTAQHAE